MAASPGPRRSRPSRTRATPRRATRIERTVAAISTTAPIEQRVEIGDAGHVICLLAEELEADVVIVGSRGRGAIKRALMGSVSSHIVHNAPCPVLVVRLKD